MIPLLALAMAGSPVTAQAVVPADPDAGQGISLAVDLIRQAHPTTCLIACAAMVMRFHGSAVDHDDLWRSVRMWADGTSFLEVENATRSRGLQAMTCGPTEDELVALLRLGLPSIIAVERSGKHTVVVRGYDTVSSSFIVLDPAHGGEAVSRVRLASEREPYARQALLIAPNLDAILGGAEGGDLPVATWVEQARRYRVAEYLRMADLEPEDELAQRLAFWEAALREDPQNRVLRQSISRRVDGFLDGRRGNRKPKGPFPRRRLQGSCPGHRFSGGLRS